MLRSTSFAARALHVGRSVSHLRSATPILRQQLHTAGCPLHARTTTARDFSRTATRPSSAILAAAAAAAATFGAVLFASTATASAESSGGASFTSGPALGSALYSCGASNFGTLGLGEVLSASVPTRIRSLPSHKRIARVVASGNAAAVLLEDGDVYTWGRGTDLALAHGDTACVSQPRLVEGLQGKVIRALSLADAHGAAVEITPAGTTRVWSWGSRAVGLPAPQKVALQSAISNDFKAATKQADFTAPTPIELKSLADEGIVQVACGTDHTLALASDGRVFSFGRDRHGALGLGRVEESTPDEPTGWFRSATSRSKPAGPAPGTEILHADEPTLIRALLPYRIVAIAAGSGSSLFLTADGEVFASGDNRHGQTGKVGSAKYLAPVRVPNLTDIVGIAAGSYHALAVDHQHRAYSFGLNLSGQCALGHRQLEVKQPTTVPLPTSARVVSVSASFETSAFVLDSGELLVAGRGTNGQLGRGDHVNESVARGHETAVDVTALANQTVVQAAMGTDVSFALVKEASGDSEASSDSKRR